jgi:hypothetical protein
MIELPLSRGIFLGPGPWQVVAGEVDAEPEPLDAGQVLDDAGRAER